MSQKEVKAASELNAPVRRHPMDLPTGARFRFVDSPAHVWVLLSKYDCGTCVEWHGIDGPSLPVCSVAESREEFVSMQVEFVA